MGGVGALAWALFCASGAAASPQSEVLLAKGEVAYHQGRDREARAWFEEAVAADPAHAEAHEMLGRVRLRQGDREGAIAALERAVTLAPNAVGARRELARLRGETQSATGVNRAITVGELGRLPSVRSEEADRPWSAHLTFGVQYDSNVTLTPRGQASVGLGDQDDMAFVLAGGGSYDLVDRSDLLVRLEYDLYQTLHPDLDDFDFRSHQPRATVSWGARPSWLWFGMQGGYNHYTLGPHSYLGEPYVMPFVSFLEETWGLTQLVYRWGQDTYFSTAFSNALLRDGPNNAASLSQSFFFEDNRYVTVGYQFGTEDPDSSRGNAFELEANEVYAGGGLEGPLGTYIDLLYLYRNDDYTKRESGIDPTSGVRQASHRQDDGHFFYMGITRPITEHVAIAVTYYGAFNGSDVSSYDYRRNVVATLLQVTY